MTVFKQFTFDSAHFLPNVDDNHKCRSVHGHTYILTIYIEREPDKNLGWVMDFAEIKSAVLPVLKIIDHKMLNDIPGLENPTCELIAKWLWEKIKSLIPSMNKIELRENPASGVIYEGE